HLACFPIGRVGGSQVLDLLVGLLPVVAVIRLGPFQAPGDQAGTWSRTIKDARPVFQDCPGGFGHPAGRAQEAPPPYSSAGPRVTWPSTRSAPAPSGRTPPCAARSCPSWPAC